MLVFFRVVPCRSLLTPEFYAYKIYIIICHFRTQIDDKWTIVTPFFQLKRKSDQFESLTKTRVYSKYVGLFVILTDTIDLQNHINEHLACK